MCVYSLQKEVVGEAHSHTPGPDAYVWNKLLVFMVIRMLSDVGMII